MEKPPFCSVTLDVAVHCEQNLSAKSSARARVVALALFFCDIFLSIDDADAHIAKHPVIYDKKHNLITLSAKLPSVLASIEPLLDENVKNKRSTENLAHSISESALLPIPTRNTILKDIIFGNDETTQLVKNGDYAKAILIYQQAIIEHPDDKNAILGLAQAELLQGNYAYAKQMLDGYKNTFGEDSRYLVEMARLFALTNQPQNALDIITRLLQKDPTNTTFLKIQSYILTHANGLLTNTRNPEFAEISLDDEDANKSEEAGNYQKALQLFQQSYDKNQNDKFAFIRIIRVELYIGKYDRAAKNLALYKSKFGEDARYLEEKARYLAIMDKPQQALEILKVLQQENPAGSSLLTLHEYALTQLNTLKTRPKEQTVVTVQLPSAKQLAHIAQLNGKNPDLFITAAHAYINSNNNSDALLMIDEALKRDPTNSNYLKLKASVVDATTAYGIYKRIYAANKNVPQIILGLAQRAANLNKLDEAANLYSIYTTKYPKEPKPWLEYAFIQSWRGNDRGAVWVLSQYQKHFGVTKEYLIARARILASANRPTEALHIVNQLLPTNKNNYDLNYANTTALYYNNQPIEMFQSLAIVNQLAPNTQETEGLNEFISTPYRSNISLDTYHSFDTDTVNTNRASLSGVYFLSPSTSILANFTPEQISATQSSGLNPIEGGTSLAFYNYSLGLANQFNSHLGMLGWIGGASISNGRNALIYEGDALTKVSDNVKINVQLKRSIYDQSPLAVSLDVIQNLNQVQFLLEPCLQCYATVNTSYSTFSDTNSMNNINGNLAVSVISSELFNVKLGTSGQWQGFSKQLNDGYYNPKNYRFYNVNADILYKQSDNINYELSIGLGVQKDETFIGYKPANDYALRAYYGIYQDWYLILTAAMSTRGRGIANNPTVGTYRVTSFDAALTRRF